MLYFKPAGARGQALHQDQYYLRVQPGTCMAAWLALDDCDEANGCMQVVPGSHTWPVLCTTKADTTQSFTDVTVPLPEGTEVRPVIMRAGDVLFFNGQLVHGSFPNRTTDRFRRSLIGHYIQGEASEVARWYHPVLRMDGTPLELGVSPGGMRCGLWVEQDGTPALVEDGYQVVDPATHDEGAVQRAWCARRWTTDDGRTVDTAAPIVPRAQASSSPSSVCSTRWALSASQSASRSSASSRSIPLISLIRSIR
jgi:hypothetical protein